MLNQLAGRRQALGEFIHRRPNARTADSRHNQLGARFRLELPAAVSTAGDAPFPDRVLLASYDGGEPRRPGNQPDVKLTPKQPAHLE